LSSEYERGFKQGWLARSEVDFAVSQGDTRPRDVIGREKFDIGMQPSFRKPRKRKQSSKQKLLTEMTDKKWKAYKKGSGKKTYVQIRAMVSRSQEYKRKAKKL